MGLLQASERNSKAAEHARATMESHLRYEREALRLISDRIAGGESSGDPLTDFIFRHQSGASLEMVERYHALNSAIASHKGKLVLVIECTEVDTRLHPHLPQRRPQDFRLRTHCAVGIIRGTELLLDWERGVSAIPTGKHLMFSGDPAELLGNIELEPNDAPVPNTDNIQARGAGHDLGASLERPLRIKNPMTRALWEGHPCYAIEMIIGDEKVAAWFHANDKDGLLEQVARYFDHPVPTPAAP